jgi:hypothetical protein
MRERPPGEAAVRVPVGVGPTVRRCSSSCRSRRRRRSDSRRGSTGSRSSRRRSFGAAGSCWCPRGPTLAQVAPSCRRIESALQVRCSTTFAHFQGEPYAAAVDDGPLLKEPGPTAKSVTNAGWDERRLHGREPGPEREQRRRNPTETAREPLFSSGFPSASPRARPTTPATQTALYSGWGHGQTAATPGSPGG